MWPTGLSPPHVHEGVSFHPSSSGLSKNGAVPDAIVTSMALSSRRTPSCAHRYGATPVIREPVAMASTNPLGSHMKSTFFVPFPFHPEASLSLSHRGFRAPMGLTVDDLLTLPT